MAKNSFFLLWFLLIVEGLLFFLTLSAGTLTSSLVSRENSNVREADGTALAGQRLVDTGMPGRSLAFSLLDQTLSIFLKITQQFSNFFFEISGSC